MLILVGLLLQWPILLTLAMFPVLVWIYARLARKEEQDMQARFGEAYVRLVAGRPRFVPSLPGDKLKAVINRVRRTFRR